MAILTVLYIVVF